MSGDRKLEAFLDKNKNLWFCRGKGKCTATWPRNKKCEDCITGRDDETLEQIAERIDRGEA